MSHIFSHTFWYGAQVLQASIVVALFARGLQWRLPAFTAYVMVEMVTEPLLTLAQGSWPYVYYYGYWVTVVATTTLSVAVCYEVVEHVWRPFGTGRKLGRTLVWLIAGFAVVQGVMTLLAPTGLAFGLDSIPGLILMLDRDVRIVVCGVGAFILIFRRRLGLSLRKLPVGVVAGFVLFSAVHLSVATAISHSTVLHRSTLSEINSGAYLLAALIWLAYAVFSPNLTRDDSPGSPPPSLPGGRGYALIRNLWKVDWAARALPAAFRRE